jgi:DNA polymerase-3 subunit delta
MSADAAGLFVDQVGTSLGLLGQELAKLHSVLPADQEITPECVAQLVPRSREANVFDILDAIADGKPNIAFHVLHETLAQGGEPIAVLGALTFQLRRLSQVGRFLAQGQALGPALDAAGIPNWPKVRISTEKLARHLGLRRLGKITDWLVDINLGLKGGNSLPPKVQLEVLLTRLARPRE